MAYMPLQHAWLDTFSVLSDIPLQYTDKSAALQKITELVRQAMGSHACTLVLIDLERQMLTHAAGAGPNATFEQFMRQREVRLGSRQEGSAMELAQLRKGEIIRASDLEKNGQGVANPHVARQYGLKSVLCYPLKVNEHILGYLNHFLGSSREFSQDEERLLGIFARQAALTIEKFDQYQTRDRLSTILHDLSQSLLSMPLDGCFREVASKACELLKVPTCIVWQLEEDLEKGRQKLTIASATDDVDMKYRGLQLYLDDPYVSAHLERRKVGYLADVTQPDNKNYKHPQEAKERAWVSLLSAPMWVEGSLLGMLDIYTLFSRTFTLQEKALFETFANHAALAIQKAQLRQEASTLRERQRIAEDLHTVASSELNGALQHIAQLCAKAFHADTCSLRLWNKATDILRLQAFYDKDTRTPNEPSERYDLPLGEGVAGYVASTGKSYPNKDHSPLYKGAHGGERLTSMLCAPLKSGEEVIGTLGVGSRKQNAFTTYDLRFLESITGSFSIAIERAHFMENLVRLAERATRDPSLPNLLEEIASLTRRLIRIPICMIWMLDKNKNGFAPCAFSGALEDKDKVENLFISNEVPEIQEFLASENPSYVRDIAEDPYPYSRILRDLCWKSVLRLRLVVEERVIGFLEIYSRGQERDFSQFHQELFRTFTGQAAIAISNVINRERAETLNKITQTVAEARSTVALLPLLLQKGLELTGSTWGWISRVISPVHQEIVTSQGMPCSLPRLHSNDKGIAGDVLRTERPSNVPEIQESPALQIVSLPSAPNTRSVLAVPLVIQNAEMRIGKTVQPASMPIGVLQIESPTANAFSQSHEDILWWLARYGSVIFGRLDSDEKLATLSEIEKSGLQVKEETEVISSALGRMREVMRFEFATVFVVNPERNHLRVEEITGLSKNEANKWRTSITYPLGDDSIQARVLASRETTVLPVESRYKWAHLPMPEQAKLVCVYVPVLSALDNRGIGLLEVVYQAGAIEGIYERDVQILVRFAAYIAQILEQRDRGLLDQVVHEFTAPIVGIRNNMSYLKRHISRVQEVMMNQMNFFSRTPSYVQHPRCAMMWS
ncbi:MAG: GAF domain-containing protein [Candidatus Tectimicrobiota bacterium]